MMVYRLPMLLVLSCLVCGCVGYAGQSQDVTFVSADGVRLSGSLVLPTQPVARMPGVVLLHGAEPATRSFAYRMHANIFLRRGMAVLLYDKRGAGESGGNHDSATYAQLIDDAVAAIAFLRTRPEIEPAHVGVVGASESGWLTPEIAERAGHLAFVINKVGPCLSWRETVAWEVYNDLRADDVSADAARQQTAVFERIWAYYLSPSPQERLALEETLRAWAGRKDSHLPVELEPVSPSYVQDIGYDPGRFLERTTTPMLYVYGSDDINVPTARCVERLNEIRRTGRPVSFHVFEHEGHELGGVGPLGYRFVEGYEALLGAFADSAVRAAHAPSEAIGVLHARP